MQVIKKVLIVEDIADVATWLEAQVHSLLAPESLEISNNLASAKQCIEQKQYDLVLLDLGLPDGDGHTLIPAIKAANDKALCIITTIFDDADHLLNALQAGADGYLLKDDSEKEFAQQLAGILDGRPPLSASIARCLLQQFHSPKTAQDTALTQRENDVLSLVAQGLSVKVAAKKLDISPQTAASYLKKVYQKLQVNSRAEATIKAIKLGLIQAQ